MALRDWAAGAPHLTELAVQRQHETLSAALRPYTVAGNYGQLLDAGGDDPVEGRFQVFELKHNLQRFHALFVERFDEGEGTFLEKFRKQLEAADDDIFQAANCLSALSPPRRNQSS